jgi:ferrochelatase
MISKMTSFADLVICPGFSADCLETLEEINKENRGYFIQAGGKTFSYIPALNDRKDHIKALSNIISKHL